MKTFFAAAIAVACLGYAGAASADPGYINAGVNLRAGPGTDFPRITTLQRGRQVEVRGCIQSREWCDVSFRGGRGWVSARYLDINFQGSRRGYWGNRQRARMPIISWNMNSYWDENYRGQSFNRNRDRYRNYGPRSEPTRGGNDRDRDNRSDDRGQNGNRDGQGQTRDRDDRTSSGDRDDRGGNDRDNRTDGNRASDGTRSNDRASGQNTQNCDDPNTAVRETCPARRP